LGSSWIAAFIAALVFGARNGLNEGVLSPAYPRDDDTGRQLA
jgi:hypothetical protein